MKNMIRWTVLIVTAFTLAFGAAMLTAGCNADRTTPVDCDGFGPDSTDEWSCYVRAVSNFEDSVNPKKGWFEGEVRVRALTKPDAELNARLKVQNMKGLHSYTVLSVKNCYPISMHNLSAGDGGIDIDNGGPDAASDASTELTACIAVEYDCPGDHRCTRDPVGEPCVEAVPETCASSTCVGGKCAPNPFCSKSPISACEGCMLSHCCDLYFDCLHGFADVDPTCAPKLDCVFNETPLNQCTTTNITGGAFQELTTCMGTFCAECPKPIAQ